MWYLLGVVLGVFVGVPLCRKEALQHGIHLFYTTGIKLNRCVVFLVHGYQLFIILQPPG